MELLRQKTQEIRESKTVLQEYAETGKEEFMRNRQLSDAAKYRLLVAIEACIAICSHLVSRVAKKAPLTFAECFEILRQETIVSESLCQNLEQMSRFQNLIIHGYWKVDDGKVYQILQNNVEDFENYLQSVEAFLRKTEE